MKRSNATQLFQGSSRNGMCYTKTVSRSLSRPSFTHANAVGKAVWVRVDRIMWPGKIEAVEVRGRRVTCTCGFFNEDSM